MNHQFISKCVYFPKQGILAVGDLHIGYESGLIQSGILIPKAQIKELTEQLDKIISQVKPKKIIFLGDLKHSFGFRWKEKDEFNEVLDFLKTKISEKNIILIKGNHDTIDYTFKDKLKNLYIEDGIAFTHGHKDFLQLSQKEIKTIVLAHIHPAIILTEKNGVKKEKFKCFLTGKYRGKETIILPSFLGINEGDPINNYKDDYEDEFSIIPKKNLLKFKIHVIGEDKIYNFGKVKDFV